MAANAAAPFLSVSTWGRSLSGLHRLTEFTASISAGFSGGLRIPPAPPALLITREILFNRA